MCLNNCGPQKCKYCSESNPHVLTACYQGGAFIGKLCVGCMRKTQHCLGCGEWKRLNALYGGFCANCVDEINEMDKELGIRL